jgi:hypothetical protein
MKEADKAKANNAEGLNRRRAPALVRAREGGAS